MIARMALVSAIGLNANKQSGIVWGEQVFKEYIKDPSARVPGTKLVFVGIKSYARHLWR